MEWSGAVAKNAAIKFVVSKSTNASDGSYLSAQYIVNHNLAPVMSMSFGICEAALGSSGNSFINSLWQQAASQGITVFVSSGDSGAAGCDSASSSRATHGSSREWSVLFALQRLRRRHGIQRYLASITLLVDLERIRHAILGAELHSGGRVERK